MRGDEALARLVLIFIVGMISQTDESRPRVKETLIVSLGPDAPNRAHAILEAQPRVSLRKADTSALQVGSRTYPLTVLPRSLGSLARLVGGPADRDAVTLVIAERLTAEERQVLEDSHLSYADAAGHVHIDAPSMLFHVEPGTARSPERIPAPRGLGVVGVRVAQTLLNGHSEDWTVSTLAVAAEASVGQVHNILRRLEEEGFVDRAGRARTSRRRVANPAGLLDWLATVPAARRVRRQCSAFLYAADPDDLLVRLASAAESADLAYAVTGAAAAHAMDVPAVTAVSIVSVRVPSDLQSEAVAASLGAEPVHGGANLTLIADYGRLGTHDRTWMRKVALATPVRIWLDMLSEPRGGDAAELFRGAVLGY